MANRREVGGREGDQDKVKVEGGGSIPATPPNLNNLTSNQTYQVVTVVEYNAQLFFIVFTSKVLNRCFTTVICLENVILYTLRVGVAA